MLDYFAGFTLGKYINVKHEKAYSVYKFLHGKAKKYEGKDLVYWIRMLECAVDEAGIKGTDLKLISVKALESKIKQARGESVSNLDKESLEHPITYRVLAKHCLNQDEPLSMDDFISFWLDNLVFVTVTSRQNFILKDFQKNFKFGDCWKKMYKRAGIVLVDDVDLRNNDTRMEYGLKPIQRGRKKGIK